MLPQFGKFIVVCGHYGCGKTNFALNLAIRLADEGRKVTLVDLDIVSPYFRSSDYEPLLQKHGIQLIAPVYAHSNLDLPALPAQIYSVFSMTDRTVILDVGGDDAGATALGRFSHNIIELGNYQMLYLINKYRVLTTQPHEAAALLHEIEAASRLKATGIVNNSHMQELTTAEDILNAGEYACKTAQELSLPLVMTTAPRELVPQLTGRVDSLYPIDIYVKAPWN